MTIMEQIRTRIRDSMKNKTTEKDILRVLLGKMQTIEANEGTLTDDKAIGVVRSLIKSNKESLEVLEADIAEKNSKGGNLKIPEDFKQKCDNEIKVLQSFLPTYLPADEIMGLLMLDGVVLENINKAHKPDAATGIAMKFFRSKDLKVEGNTVKEVVKNIWTVSHTEG